MLTHTTWLAELTRLQAQRPPDDEGLTKGEIAEALGKCTRTVGLLLQAAQKSGALQVGTRYQPNVLGRLVPIPVYRISAK